MSLRIVLVETQGALNLGAVARVMKNMGLDRLHLVNPLCSPYDSEAKQMAVHAQDVLAKAQIFPSLPAALTGCQRVLGTCGRSNNCLTCVSPPQGIAWLQGVGESALVFGAEDRGLSKEELQYCQGVITIPTVAAYPSLNLAQAVAICCYQWRLSQVDDPTPPPIVPAPVEAIEGLFSHLERVLLQIGYLYPHTAFARMQKFRKMVQRAQLTQEEVTMLRGILSQVQWAVEGNKTHA
ncbi:MAG: RNA methyltransferase [Pseudanabaenaceae cyanobacterium SKYGB_i_bin29]|nr:RNA methyltransferase [Pseudanabaenaceae cyanobacterium SKYG29]MDW8421345.1 RNA methyltransferase [Pseudanabaenaceae cyanobacterium SKYGB_i_bin29]